MDGGGSTLDVRVGVSIFAESGSFLLRFKVLLKISIFKK